MTVVLPGASRLAPPSARIIGLDLARAMAMLGMVIAHYAWPDGSGSALDTAAEAVSGRAMPLFVLLGGIGATILSARSTKPDRTLLIRASILYPAGLLLQELTTFIAIILQSYGLFFALAPPAPSAQQPMVGHSDGARGPRRGLDLSGGRADP